MAAAFSKRNRDREKEKLEKQKGEKEKGEKEKEKERHKRARVKDEDDDDGDAVGPDRQCSPPHDYMTKCVKPLRHLERRSAKSSRSSNQNVPFG